MFEQYQVVSCERTFSIVYSKGRKDVFSDWQRLRIFDTNQSEVVKKVVINIKALLLLPQSKEPRSYEIEIDFDSLITAIKLPKELAENQSADEADDQDSPPAWWILRQQGTARMLITYSDYVVATTLSTAIENWFKALKTAPGVQLSGNIRRFFSYSIVSNFPYVITGVMGLFACDKIFLIASSQNWSLSKISIALTMLIFLALIIFKFVDTVIDQFTDYVFSLSPVSSIRLTKGDAELYAASQKQNRTNMIKGGLALIGAVAVGVAGNAVYELIVKRLLA